MPRHVEIVGPPGAPAVVFSNALGTTSDLWHPQVPALSANFRVVLYDHPPLASVEALARHVLDLADELHLERFSFCGLSLGGMVGMWLGANAPDRLDKLVLACTSARFGVPEEWRERAALVRAEGMAGVAYDALDKWFTPAYQEREPFLRMQLETSADDYALGLEAIGAFDFRDRLSLIKRPTLVIAGEADEATTPADAAFIADRIPAAHLVVVQGGAHLANVEQPRAFNAALREQLVDTQ